MSEPLKEIRPSEVEALLRENPSASVIDVREDEEVAQGKIPEAKHIPMGEVPERLDEIDQDEEHVIVCRSGGRSGKVADFLQSQGYQVKNMVGGMLEWEGEVSPKQ